METQLKLFVDNQKDFLKFLKTKFHLYHLSNVFFRDIHYGVMSYLDLNNLKYRYTKAEDLTRDIIRSLEDAGILKKVDNQAWVLVYPEFKKPMVKPAAPPKPAAAPKPATPPATATTKPAITPGPKPPTATSPQSATEKPTN